MFEGIQEILLGQYEAQQYVMNTDKAKQQKKLSLRLEKISGFFVRTSYEDTFFPAESGQIPDELSKIIRDYKGDIVLMQNIEEIIDSEIGVLIKYFPLSDEFKHKFLMLLAR